MGKKPVKTEILHLRISPDLKAAIVQAARDDTRTIASLAEKALRDWLTEHSYLGKSKPKR
jgi:hypothetical protein